MAITSRAARTTDLGSRATPAVVGPGSYIKTMNEPSMHAYAPFTSTAERVMGAKVDPKKVMPGPGEYQLSRQGHISNASRGAGSAFASKVARLATLQADDRPGPGQYALRNDWVTPASHAGGKGPPSRGIAHSRVPNAPSIPAPEQSYGYEETHAGELGLQKPPPGGYSGVSGRLSAGPGSYDPRKASAITKPHTTGVAWGNSRVQRSTFGSTSDTPGPGAYRAGSSENADPASVAASQRGGAAFKSKTPMTHQLATDVEHVTPGPGAYASSTFFNPRSIPENMQTFGSTQKRLASDAVTTTQRQKAGQPGPGAYDEKRTDFRGQKPDRSALSSFNTSEQRFKPMLKGGKPGPGAYDQQDQYSLVANLQKKTQGRNGVFGSTTRRFHTLKQDPVPGAGAYNPVKPSVKDQGDEPTSSFASGTERLAKTAPATLKGATREAVPPPWHYAPPSGNKWDKPGASSRKANSIFGSTAQRFGAGDRPNGRSRINVPGPGSYQPKYPEEGFRKQQTTTECFGSKASRFGVAGGFSANTPIPGPGDYESGIETTDPLIKRTFNITIS